MSKKWCGVLACLILCLFVSIGNVIFNNYTIGDHFGSFAFGATTFPLSHYLDIHYYYSIQHPFNDWSLNQSFWDYLIKTAIFGEYSDWSSPHVATALVFLLMALILYTFLPWLVAKRQNWRGMLPHLLTGIALIYLIGFTVKGGVWPFNDVRYIFPSLVCLTIFFGKSYEIYKERGALVLLVLGPLLVVCFTTLSIFFFWNNFR